MRSPKFTVNGWSERNNTRPPEFGAPDPSALLAPENPLDTLRKLQFVDRRENVVLLAPPSGLGTRNPAIRLAITAADRGRVVCYGTLADLVRSLEDARKANLLRQRLVRLSAPALLVVDGIGLTPIRPVGAALFFRLMLRRLNRTATLLCAYQKVEDWREVFGDVVANALLEKVLQHCFVFDIPADGTQNTRALTV